jgi:hypothetical protein
MQNPEKSNRITPLSRPWPKVGRLPRFRDGIICREDGVCGDLLETTWSPFRRPFSPVRSGMAPPAAWTTINPLSRRFTIFPLFLIILNLLPFPFSSRSSIAPPFTPIFRTGSQRIRCATAIVSSSPFPLFRRPSSIDRYVLRISIALC